MNRVSKKGTFIFILFLVALTITGLGIFLDDEVIPPLPDTERIVKDAAVQSSLAQRSAVKTEISEPSEVAEQLKRAIDAANRNEDSDASQLDARTITSQTLIEETNQLLEEKGGSGKAVSGNEKLKQFNQQLDELKSKLAEINSSD